LKEGATTEMSWMGKKPGRRKEEGGHRRTDVSFSYRILKVLEVPEIQSKYAEDCVKACTEIKWIAFNESSVAVNDNYCDPTSGATFVWFPSDRGHNAVIAAYCGFQYRCTGQSFRYRMRIKEAVTPFFEAPGSLAWCPFQFYTDSSFADGIDVECNQNGYVIEIQFEPYGSSDCAFVKDICVFLEVVDGLLELGH
jgi:hypothetical protein